MVIFFSCNSPVQKFNLPNMDSESNESYITFNMASFLRTKEICVKYVIWVAFAPFFFVCAFIYALASSYTPEPCKKVNVVTKL